MIIYDRYFKAKIHLLILPKVNVQSVYDLDPMNDAHIALIEGMIARAKWIQHGLRKRKGGCDVIHYGFHAIPSMNQLHLHVISDDMESDNLKNKKHYLSFKSDYFVPGKVMLRILKTEKKRFTVNKEHYKGLLKEGLKCHKCFHEIRTIPAVKKHLRQCRYGKGRKMNHNQFDSNSLSIDECNLSFREDEYEDFKVVFANNL